VVRLPVGSRPYDKNTPPHLDFVAPYHDANGVPMAPVGGHLVYKPAGLGQWAVSALNGYRKTGDPRYLAMARGVGRVFVRIGRLSGGGLYIPYLFDFAMHRNAADIIHKPWYSAMAQGLALSLFTRLYQATRNPNDLAVARKLFLSMRHIGRGTTPWVTYVDGSRYLWLEEYAQHYPEHTLNGFMFASFGLYDYWLLTGDPTVLQEYRGAMTTLKANVMRYRNPGGPIDYCLKHGKPQLKYHEVVIWQLKFASVITGDPYFAYVARVFARDA
jgi:D-glucuronyl C5-epimerase C-terminus